jgi:tetratricopeptide (TPR) repeat protein
LTDRSVIADALDEIGLLLELAGENPFKVRAYASGARILRSLDTDLSELIQTKRLGQIKGIGPALAEKIGTLATTGSLPYLDNLRTRIPSGLLDWLKVPGLGPKKARVIHVTLGIATLDELEAAAREGRLRDLGGFGDTTEKKILEGIARVRAHSGRFLRPIVLAEATRLLESGRIDEAQTIVSRLRASPNPDLQVLFLSGALYAIKGRYSEAAEEFRLMLARDPTLVRPRLELARALFLAREYNAARYHFEQVLASPLPDMVRANVLNYLTLIRERVPSFAFSFDIVSDSNPKQATSSSIVEIGGLLYQLNQSALAQRATGILVTAQGKVPLPADPSWFVRGYVEHYDYPGGALDQGYGQVLAGKHIDLGPHGLSCLRRVGLDDPS